MEEMFEGGGIVSASAELGKAVGSLSWEDGYVEEMAFFIDMGEGIQSLDSLAVKGGWLYSKKRTCVQKQKCDVCTHLRQLSVVGVLYNTYMHYVCEVKLTRSIGARCVRFAVNSAISPTCSERFIENAARLGHIPRLPQHGCASFEKRVPRIGKIT
ncbi:unnamed protein product [Toxocara canis]|uniref:Uncharacterized protein n=1 Tax=Toxocara canis TaxID=6265 RepID=A0A183TV52_TOXCA|nr:unnamed protein product [Toxocara canis]